MSMVNEFVTQLVRAANEVTKINGFQKRRLLDRAIFIIRDLRLQAKIYPQLRSPDITSQLQMAADDLIHGQVSNDQIQKLLLEAAGAIRELHVGLDSKTGTRFD